MAKKIITRPTGAGPKPGRKSRAKAPPLRRGKKKKAHEAVATDMREKLASVQTLAGDVSITAALDEAEKLVRAYPLPAIGAGLTVGLLLGLLLGRSS